jgi:hypothetical protein
MSYIPEDDEENDSGNHMMPTISEAILNVFMISLGNFGDIWDALAATNHKVIGEVKTLYNNSLVRVKEVQIVYRLCLSSELLLTAWKHIE